MLTVTLGIVNREQAAHQYRVEVWAIDLYSPTHTTQVLAQGPFALAPGQTLEQPIRWTLPWATQDEEVELPALPGRRARRDAALPAAAAVAERGDARAGGGAMSAAREARRLVLPRPRLAGAAEARSLLDQAFAALARGRRSRRPTWRGWRGRGRRDRQPAGEGLGHVAAGDDLPGGARHLGSLPVPADGPPASAGAGGARFQPRSTRRAAAGRLAAWTGRAEPRARPRSGRARAGAARRARPQLTVRRAAGPGPGCLAALVPRTGASHVRYASHSYVPADCAARAAGSGTGGVRRRPRRGVRPAAAARRAGPPPALAAALARAAGSAAFVPTIYLLCIALAEIVTVLVSPQVGVAFHALILLAIPVHYGGRRRTATGKRR